MTGISLIHRLSTTTGTSGTDIRGSAMVAGSHTMERRTVGFNMADSRTAARHPASTPAHSAASIMEVSRTHFPRAEVPASAEGFTAAAQVCTLQEEVIDEHETSYTHPAVGRFYPTVRSPAFE